MPENPNRYLDLMNFQSSEEAYARVKELASELTDDEHLIRSCIFDLHAAIEVELRRIYYHTFHAHLFLTDHEEHNKATVDRFDRMIRRLGFMEMYRVLQPLLNSWPYPDFESIHAINETRNLAAHSEATEKVAYKGRNPFKDADCFAQMYFDVWAIKQSIPKYFYYAIERTKAQLGRYVDKYGPGEL